MNNNYLDETKNRWGNTTLYQEYSNKTKNHSKDKWNEIIDGLNSIFKEFSVCLDKGVLHNSLLTQKLVEKLQNYITSNFYTCSSEILLNLGKMYVEDERFYKNIDSLGKGTAIYINEAIKYYYIKKRL